MALTLSSSRDSSAEFKKPVTKPGPCLPLGNATDTASLNNCFYLNLTRYEVGCTEWFNVHLDTNKKRGRPSGISCLSAIPLSKEGFYATSGSVLYVIGCRYVDREKNKLMSGKSVSFCDLCRPEDGLQDLPPMFSSRAYGNAMVLQQKLFVFGGCLGADNFGEYYDLGINGSGEWVKMDLPEALTYPYFCASYAVAYDDHRIFVIFRMTDDAPKDTYPQDEATFTYNVKSDSWEACEVPYALVPYENTSPLIVDGTLYWIKGGYGVGVYAYDFTSRQLYENRLLDFLMKIEQKYPPFVHLGGNRFCTLIINPPSDYSVLDTFASLRVYMFRISKTGDGRLNVCTYSIQSLPLGRLRRFVDINYTISLNCTSAKIGIDKGKDTKTLVGSKAGVKIKKKALAIRNQ